MVLIQHGDRRRALPADRRARRVFRILLTSLHGAAVVRLCDRLAPGEDADALAQRHARCHAHRVCAPARHEFHPTCPEYTATQ